MQMTDDKGRPTLIEAAMEEPNIDSVVLTDGLHGTAWQRLSDGLWYGVSKSQPTGWSTLRQRRNLVLVYDAPVRA